MNPNASVRWSPHSNAGRQQFLKINSREHELDLYTVTQSKGKILKYELYKHKKIPYPRSFDWSPVDEDLIAIGATSGEALLLRISTNGDGLIPSLAIKHQRNCNGVSFNSTGALLATGLEKVRNDFCLNIWDVNQHLGLTNQELARPVRQLATGEAVTSVRFFRDQANTLVAGVGYRWVRAFDLRESPSNPSMSTLSRCIYGISLDKDPNYFASHSDDGLISVWDRRFVRSSSSSIEPALFFNKPAEESSSTGIRTASLCYSPSQEGAFAVLNSVGGLKIYETNKISDQDPPPPSSTGILGGRSSAAIEIPKPRIIGWRDSAASLLDGRMNGGGTSSGSRTPNLRTDGETIFVTRINDVVKPSLSPSRKHRRVTSFDWIPDCGQGKAGGLRMLCVRDDGAMEVVESIEPAMSLAWGSRNGFSMTDGKDLKIIPMPDSKAVAEESKIQEAKSREEEELDGGLYSSSPSMRLGMHEKRRLERSNSLVRPEDFMFEPAEVLKNDVCFTMRARVERGYEMDCKKNIELTDDVNLKDMWLWLAGAQECAQDGGMVSGLLDLSYMGVLGVWYGGKVPTPDSRLITGRRADRSDWTAAIADINKRSNRESFTGPTEFPHQRRLALAICGWDFSLSNLESRLNKLEKHQEYAKAAGWALFHGNIERSINSLSQGDQQMKLMSTAVAGYFSHTTRTPGNDGNVKNSAGNIWQKLCRDMATELDDPYLRAIFTYVSDGEWKDVLDDVGLPLRERLGIALRWLRDDQLCNYLEDLTKTVVGDGDVEGIVLTGVSDQKAVELLQVYVNRFGDVQTAALVAGFAVPRYFDDERVEYWVESYRQLLNSWRLFHARAKFDVARGKKSRDRNGIMTTGIAQRQVYVRCANCDRSVSHSFSHPAPKLKDGKQMTMREKQASTPGGTTTKSTVCPHCKKSLPRCAVCLLNLGTVCYQKSSTTTSTTAATAGEDGKPEADYDQWFNFCLSCNHGMHAGHARDWFSKHRLCPVPDCECHCKM